MRPTATDAGVDPFAGWTPAKGEADLPMFGTIRHMYQCYFDYLHMKYKDHTTLWDYVFNSDARQRTGEQQNDLFNSFTYPGHPMREYMGFETTVAQSYPDAAFAQMIEIMNAITDQGEGSTLMERAGSGLDKVKPRYMESKTAMESDYPSYTDDGTLVPSADAVARFDSARHDHYERFLEVRDSIRHVVTWPHWLKKKGKALPGFQGGGKLLIINTLRRRHARARPTAVRHDCCVTRHPTGFRIDRGCVAVSEAAGSAD